MKAIGNNIIIRKIDEGTTTTKGGLLLAKNQREDVRYTKAIIVSVGDEASVSGLQQQDVVYFDRQLCFMPAATAHVFFRWLV